MVTIRRCQKLHSKRDTVDPPHLGPLSPQLTSPGTYVFPIKMFPLWDFLTPYYGFFHCLSESCRILLFFFQHCSLLPDLSLLSLVNILLPEASTWGWLINSPFFGTGISAPTSLMSSRFLICKSSRHSFRPQTTQIKP